MLFFISLGFNCEYREYIVYVLEVRYRVFVLDNIKFLKVIYWGSLILFILINIFIDYFEMEVL